MTNYPKEEQSVGRAAAGVFRKLLETTVCAFRFSNHCPCMSSLIQNEKIIGTTTVTEMTTLPHHITYNLTQNQETVFLFGTITHIKSKKVGVDALNDFQIHFLKPGSQSEVRVSVSQVIAVSIKKHKQKFSICSSLKTIISFFYSKKKNPSTQ